MSAPATGLPRPPQRVTEVTPIAPPAQPQQNNIAELAYALWQQRGYPEGSAEIDWIEAEKQVAR